MNLFPFHVKLYLICGIKGGPILVIPSSFSLLGLLALGWVWFKVSFPLYCWSVAPQVPEKYLISCLFISADFISFSRASLPSLCQLLFLWMTWTMRRPQVRLYLLLRGARAEAPSLTPLSWLPPSSLWNEKSELLCSLTRVPLPAVTKCVFFLLPLAQMEAPIPPGTEGNGPEPLLQIWLASTPCSSTSPCSAPSFSEFDPPVLLLITSPL